MCLATLFIFKLLVRINIFKYINISMRVYSKLRRTQFVFCRGRSRGKNVDFDVYRERACV